MVDFDTKAIPFIEQTNESNVANKVRSPWRRYFARTLDISLYTYFVMAFQALVFNVNMITRSTLENLLGTTLAFLIMMLVEPVMLSRLGTTPGKWLLGLRVTGIDGQHLSYLDALSRTVTIFWRGFGFNIPIYNAFRLWKSYKDCAAGELMDWECDSVIHLKDQKKWRTAGYIVVTITLIVLLIYTNDLAAMPRNRGDLSIAAFSENYNQLLDYYDVNAENELSESGNWVTHKLDTETFQYFGDDLPPTFKYTVDNGIMTGLQFEMEIKDSDTLITPYNTEIALSILAYVNGREGNQPFSNNLTERIKQIEATPFEDFQFTVHDISISCDYDYSGGEATYFSVVFKMAATQ